MTVRKAPGVVKDETALFPLQNPTSCAVSPGIQLTLPGALSTIQIDETAHHLRGTPMQIPTQPIELRSVIILATDARLAITMFPLPSHGREHPYDLLEGFLNRRQAEFFPLRMPDGSELILPLSEVMIFEIGPAEARDAQQKYPHMSHQSVISDPATTVSYTRVSISLRGERTVRGSIWFPEHVPENKQNLLDVLNEGPRYLTIHSRGRISFVRDAVTRAQIMMDDEIADTGDVAELAENTRVSKDLVDTSIDFSPTGTGGQDKYSSEAVSLPPDLEVTAMEEGLEEEPRTAQQESLEEAPPPAPDHRQLRAEDFYGGLRVDPSTSAERGEEFPKPGGASEKRRVANTRDLPKPSPDQLYPPKDSGQ